MTKKKVIIRGNCAICGREATLSSHVGYCGTCKAVSLEVADDESPCVLDESGWFNDHGIMRYLGSAS